MTSWNFKSLCHKLIVSIGITATVGLSAVALMSYQQSRAVIWRNAEFNLDQQSFALADKIDRNLLERYRDVRHSRFIPALAAHRAR